MTQMLCSFMCDFVGGEVECSECLYRQRLIPMTSMREYSLTLLTCNTLLRCCAPSSAIPLYERSSVVSVYIDKDLFL
jgi:hypothetical protein